MSNKDTHHKFGVGDLAVFERAGYLFGDSLHSVYDTRNVFSTKGYKRVFYELLGINYMRGEEPPDKANINIKTLDSIKYELKNRNLEEFLEIFESLSGYHFDRKANEMYLFDDQVCIAINEKQSLIWFGGKEGVIRDLGLEDIFTFVEGVEKIAKNYRYVRRNNVHLSIEYYREGKKVGEIEIDNDQTVLFPVKL